MLMYNIKKFLRAMSEELQQMDANTHKTNSKVLPPSELDNNEHDFVLYFYISNVGKRICPGKTGFLLTKAKLRGVL